jgi:hypothetical protein
MKVLLSSLFRKLVFGVGSAWITSVLALLKSSGAFEDGEIDNEKVMGYIVQVLVALALMGGSALWSFVKRKLEARKA